MPSIKSVSRSTVSENCKLSTNGSSEKLNESNDGRIVSETKPFGDMAALMALLSATADTDISDISLINSVAKLMFLLFQFQLKIRGKFALDFGKFLCVIQHLAP